jgi:hypothetical protein
MLATLDVWARDASFGLARVEQGQVPSGSGTTIAGVSSHHLLTDLTAFDDHSQYLLLAGRVGGQTITPHDRNTIPVTIQGGVGGQNTDFFRINDESGNDNFSFRDTIDMFLSSSTGGSTMSYGLLGLAQTRSLDTTGLSIVPQTGIILGKTAGEQLFIAPALSAPNVAPQIWQIFVRANHASSTTTALLVSNQGVGTGPLTVFQHPEGTLAAKVLNTGVWRGKDTPSDLTAQTGSVGAQTLLTGTTLTAGMYRVSVYLKTTTAGGGGASVKATVAWNDGTAQTLDVSLIAAAVGVAHDLTVLNAHSQGSVVLNLAASQNITYTTTFTAGTGSPAYEIHVRTEALG